MNYNKKVLFTLPVLNEEKVLEKNVLKLNKYIKNNIKIDNKDLAKIKDIEIKDEKINFKVDLNSNKNNRKYLVITTNYFPNWKAYDQNENKLKVYWSTPSLILVELKENSKEINLSFEKEWWEHLCFYISLITYFLCILYLIFKKENKKNIYSQYI